MIGSVAPATVLIFVHIQKTGGTTLGEVLRRNYGPDGVYRMPKSYGRLPNVEELTEAQRAAIRVYEGHMPFGLHTRLAEPSTYITLVRDPVERIISQYYRILERPDHSRHAEVRSYRGLEEFAAGSGNNQVLWLSGHRAEHGRCSPDWLEQAKENLAQHFAVVGVTEQFDESLLLLRRTFGWRFVLYQRRNVTQRRPKRAELPAETVAVLEEHNRFDRELHAFARGLLAERVARQGPGFAIELEAFKRANAECVDRPEWRRARADSPRGRHTARPDRAERRRRAAERRLAASATPERQEG